MRRELEQDHRIAAVAAAQGGTVARRQLLALGLSPSAIDRRVRCGRLHVLYRGVYAVGHRVLGATGRWWAAVLACGEGALLSHWSAAHAYEIRRSAASLVDVTVGRAGRVRRAGLRLHYRSPLPDDERTTLAGLPITTPARTVLDLAAAGLRGRRLESVLDRAERERLLDFGEVRALRDRHAGRPGVPALTEVLGGYAPGSIATRSVLEELALELCDAHGLARPLVNVMVAGNERDLYWPEAGLVVELDSYAWHRSPAALNADRERDVALTLAGLRHLRFTYAQLTTRRPYVVAALLHALRE